LPPAKIVDSRDYEETAGATQAAACTSVVRSRQSAHNPDSLKR